MKTILIKDEINECKMIINCDDIALVYLKTKKSSSDDLTDDTHVVCIEMKHSNSLLNSIPIYCTSDTDAIGLIKQINDFLTFSKHNSMSIINHKVM